MCVVDIYLLKYSPAPNVILPVWWYMADVLKVWRLAESGLKNKHNKVSFVSHLVGHGLPSQDVTNTTERSFTDTHRHKQILCYRNNN